MPGKQRTIVDYEQMAREAEAANAALADGPAPDPFGGEGRMIEVTKQINVAQFDREISAQVGRDVEVSLSLPNGDGPHSIASKAKPGYLWVKPASAVTERALLEAYERHAANDEDAPEAAAPSGPLTVGDDVKAILAKAADGKTLTSAEVSKALGALAPLVQ